MPSARKSDGKPTFDRRKHGVSRGLVRRRSRRFDRRHGGVLEVEHWSSQVGERPPDARTLGVRISGAHKGTCPMRALRCHNRLFVGSGQRTQWTLLPNWYRFLNRKKSGAELRRREARRDKKQRGWTQHRVRPLSTSTFIYFYARMFCNERQDLY